MLFLVEPSMAYKDQYLAGLREFQGEDLELWLSYPDLAANFEAYLQRLRDQQDRSKIAPHMVPATEYWLIDGDEYIGRLSLRHELNATLLSWGGHIGYAIRPSKRRRGYGKQILRLGLVKAREHGLSRVLVTCDEDNTGSKKIIEHNGGILENVAEIEGLPKRKLRYWIEIA